MPHTKWSHEGYSYAAEFKKAHPWVWRRVKARDFVRVWVYKLTRWDIG